MPMPVVCAVNGVAAGAGANIALACDIVIAARSASFIQAFSKIGLIPDSGGTYLLPRLVGTARAMGLAMLGDKLSAEQAARLGPDLEVRRRRRARAEVDALLHALAQAPTRGLAATKQALYASAPTLEAQLDLERDLQRELGRQRRLSRRRHRVHGQASAALHRQVMDAGRSSIRRETRHGAGARDARRRGDVRRAIALRRRWA